jgi:hypothetical protein
LGVSDAEILQASVRQALKMMKLPPAAGAALLRNTASEIEIRTP